MPYLGHNQHEGLDVSPDDTPPVRTTESPSDDKVRTVVHKMAHGPDEERMLLELLGIDDE